MTDAIAALELLIAQVTEKKATHVERNRAARRADPSPEGRLEYDAERTGYCCAIDDMRFAAVELIRRIRSGEP